MSNTKELYAEFLQSDFWIKLSTACKLRDGYRCRRCGKTDCGMQAHHLFYRSRWSETKLEDLITICDTCHRKAHWAQSGPDQEPSEFVDFEQFAPKPLSNREIRSRRFLDSKRSRPLSAKEMRRYLRFSAGYQAAVKSTAPGATLVVGRY